MRGVTGRLAHHLARGSWGRMSYEDHCPEEVPHSRGTPAGQAGCAPAAAPHHVQRLADDAHSDDPGRVVVSADEDADGRAK